ncbi:hypothetical protein [Paeniglutamicibacter cryotolerans]|uniref:Uncharacterized protein n=1 Tax=Paeniglutamicibacter cryotolerans TaxID=670079 RepID=A0A839QGK7_9MICC|nr:hypothetical protein [Paeniglutamicibacter cryotolerans]MBB2993844.1 hypothetical protein [Paeniglutamicibacter cryotolerans]
MGIAATPASAAREHVRPAPLRIRHGRLAVAVLGVFSILTVLVGLVLAPLGVFSGWVPVLGLLALGGCFATLRSLAVGDRRRKMLARLEAARREAFTSAPVASAAEPKREAEVFDAQPGSGKRPPMLTVEELRAEARRVAERGIAVQRPAGWEPVQVPLPQYVKANMAARPAPEALPEAEMKIPKNNVSLRQQERAAEVITAGESELPVVKTPIVPVRINLDDVMQRRRA